MINPGSDPAVKRDHEASAVARAALAYRINEMPGNAMAWDFETDADFQPPSDELINFVEAALA